uniref:FkbM family methyltransferase n=1 Tax=uncultured Brachyspira sp. TaxID=221953 RepID=UPI002613B4EB
MENKKMIDKIVWWIPFKSLRNHLREYLYSILEKENLHIDSINKNKEDLDIIKNNTDIKKNKNGVTIWSHAFYNIYQYSIDNPDEFNLKLCNFKKNLDPDSIEIVNIWIKQLKCLVNNKVKIPLDFYIDHAINFLSDEQKIVESNKDIIISNIEERYFSKYNEINIPFSLHIFYYECGIVYLPSYIKNDLKNGVIIDCGAWIGDSALMFVEENYCKYVYSFEPIKKIFNELNNNVNNLKLDNKIKTFNIALSDKKNTNYMFEKGGGSFIIDSNILNIESYEKIESIDLDSFLVDINNNEDIKLIKVDVEGFEENVLIGAINTIKKYKPVLIISCYHDYIFPNGFCQMFRIKEYIENLNLGYKILFRGLEPNSTLEYNLICYIPEQNRTEQ